MLMSEQANEYYDEFGFYSPQEITRGTRRQPDADFNTGPEIGETVPKIFLPDQNGNLVNVQQNFGSLGGVVVFHRSALW